jgi:glutaredoxin 3
MSEAELTDAPRPRVLIYRTRYCPYCAMAARVLDSEGVPFTEVDVTGDHARRRWLRETSGQRTVPQIFIDGQSIGGYRELASLVRRGELEQLIARGDPNPPHSPPQSQG